MDVLVAVFGKPVPNLTKHQSSRLLSPYRSPDERRRFAAIKVTMYNRAIQNFPM